MTNNTKTDLDAIADDAGAEPQPSTQDTAGHRAMALLAQHRLATTPQLHQMVAQGSVRQTTSRTLNTLREDDLISYTVLPNSSRLRAWFLTARGARVASGWPELRGRTVQPPASGTEASLRAAHTLTVLRAHLAFLADARVRGDEYGPLDWVPEVAHRLPDTGGEDKLIADAVLHYRIVWAWPRRKAAQVGRSRSGAGSIPCARRISHTVEGASLMPRAASSPWILL